MRNFSTKELDPDFDVDDEHQGGSSAIDTPQTSASTSRARSGSKSGSRSPEVLYTKDEIEMVNRIRHCKDCYEIFQISGSVSPAVLRKKYFKLALKLHPDKCKAPGATEAFKAVRRAYTILSGSRKHENQELSMHTDCQNDKSNVDDLDLEDMFSEEDQAPLYRFLLNHRNFIEPLFTVLFYVVIIIIMIFLLYHLIAFFLDEELYKEHKRHT
ncbi:dnaJ domain-containing protein [Ditylenchus destructor]|nr:dnaJ domain-containing protein [Ditylenchus destructor]